MADNLQFTARLNKERKQSEAHKALVDEIDLMIRARYPILYIVSVEEEPVEEILELVATQGLQRRRVLFWDIVRGWSDDGADKGSVMGALLRVGKPAHPNNSSNASNINNEDRDNTIFVLRDLHPILKNPTNPSNVPVVRELKNLARELKRTRRTLVITSYTLEIPPEMTEEITVIEFPLPDVQEINYLVRHLIVPEKLQVAGLAWEQLV
ncbi:MAG: AAA family ATPase, partial [Pseudanabaena sp. RU_4_16]|nr:AAA family ATPase [Pseudanabaena sp. RU_4_16]